MGKRPKADSAIPPTKIDKVHQQKQTKLTPKNSMFFGVFGTLAGIRTRDLTLRRRTLYPAELQVHYENYESYRQQTFPLILTEKSSVGAFWGAKPQRRWSLGLKKIQQLRAFLRV